ncbi:MAG: alanine--glyoxylate aminotransferase family protein [Dictyoglomus sp.]|nr:alanine--glyoxylate aminotransferase family protein [Dictyoglomus sp.]MCX7846217.1 alanine--glyoxylate aminotransferase family protein [Dictyoglomaceae bacterium]MDW8188493.1 alanine--glyoxylate aminotransferase family protein [Dictyoglomus sp.]
MSKIYLMIPGPTPVPNDVLREMSREMINHRGPEFAKLISETTDLLKKVFKTNNDCFILTASGTGAMEASVVNFFSPEDKVVVGVCGVFGERYAKICSAYGLNVVRIKTPLGKGIEPYELEKVLEENPDTKGVFLTHNETSTGVTLDLRELAPIVKRRGILLLVDAISSLGAIDLPTDELNIDVVVSASQKALETPPGISMISVSPLAWEYYEKAKLPRFYWDLKMAKKSLEKGATPFTPAISQIFALRRALENILSKGLENNFKKHVILGNAVRNGIKSIEFFKLLAEEKYASNTVTPVITPSEINPDELRRKLRQEFGVVLAGGQGELEGKIFRIGHVGHIEPSDILVTLSSIEIMLERMGYNGVRGKAVGSAEKVFLES